MHANVFACICTLDFMHYFIEKYDTMFREDAVYVDMINYCLFEKTFDIFGVIRRKDG